MNLIIFFNKIQSLRLCLNLFTAQITPLRIKKYDSTIIAAAVHDAICNEILSVLHFLPCLVAREGKINQQFSFTSLFFSLSFMAMHPWNIEITYLLMFVQLYGTNEQVDFFYCDYISLCLCLLLLCFSLLSLKVSCYIIVQFFDSMHFLFVIFLIHVFLATYFSLMLYTSPFWVHMRREIVVII